MAESKRRRITHEDVGDVTVAHFTDRRITDPSEIQMLRDELNGVVRDGSRKLLLDFANVNFMSSMVLGPLLSLNARLDQMGGKLVLSGISADIFKVFRITRLDEKFTIVPDEQTGLGSF